VLKESKIKKYVEEENKKKEKEWLKRMQIWWDQT
jgi:hypothetical protein